MPVSIGPRTTGVTWSAGIPLPAAITSPTGMAVDTNGDWLVVDSTDAGIQVGEPPVYFRGALIRKNSGTGYTRLLAGDPARSAIVAIEFSGGGPAGTWYGEGQTTPHDAPSAKTFLGGRYYRLTYESNAPDRHFDGGDSMGASVLDSAASTNYDLITRDSANEGRGDKRVIQLEAGRYRFKTRVWSSAASLPEAALFVYRSVSGDDTLAWIASSGAGAEGGVNDPLGIGETLNTRVIEFDEIISHAATTHYTQILVIESEDGVIGVDDSNVSFYTEIERLD